MKYLAIDYGIKRTGLAICDPSETITSPLTVIQGKKNLIEEICDLVNNESIEAIVIGLPLNMDGSQGPQAKLTRKFAQQLKTNIDVPIHFQDERLSTFSAQEKLAPAQFTNKQKKRRIDAVAAAQILQAFLEQKTQ